MNQFAVTRRAADGSYKTGTLAAVLPDFVANERWLVISPHDDDAAIAGGLLLKAATEAGARVSVRVATDGRMGYTREEDRADIVEIRRRETIESYETLGVSDVVWLSYPDSDLALHTGRRRADVAGRLPDVRFGYSGLQNSITAEMRAIRPHRVIVLAETDFHPDHKTVFQESLISFFHASGSIWPELGEPWEIPEEGPRVYEVVAYTNFAAAPDYRITCPEDVFQAKLNAIASFASQRQIAALVSSIRRAGPIEFFRTVPFDLYRPERVSF